MNPIQQHRAITMHRQGVDRDFIADRVGTTEEAVRKLVERSGDTLPDLDCDRCGCDVSPNAVRILSDTAFCPGCHRTLWSDRQLAIDEYPTIFKESIR